MRIVNCKVNHLENPLGYALDTTVFSWQAEDARGKKQTAARLRVWREGDAAAPLHDSGWDHLDSLSCPVSLSLSPRTRYCWAVSVRTDAAEEAESEVNWFETGKMQEPWQGKWITCDSKEPRHPVFTKAFSLSGASIQSARLYICGLGLYEAELNGKPVSPERLTPYLNNYNSWVQYQTYDITPLLEKTNALSVSLGNGWYKGRYGFAKLPEGAGFYGDQWKLMAEIRLRYADGTEQVIGTDESWTVTRSSIFFSNIYDGEQRDDTLPPLPEAPARVLDEALPLQDRWSPPVLTQKELRPVALLHTPAGEWVYDLGQNLTGSFRLRVHVPRGARVHVQVGEVLQGGNFYRENLRSAKAEYVYISDGQPQVLEPKFTFYGYRYAKVTGVAQPKAEDFTALVYYSQVPPAGTLTTGSEKVNRLIANIQWGQWGNFVDVPTDCPQRDERMGWTADTQVFVPTACFFADSCAFYRKYLRDMRSEQSQHDGMVPNVIPCPDSRADTSSVWGDAVTIIPWQLYLFYGDKTLLSESYGSMKAWVDWLRRLDGEDRGWGRHFHYGDWVALDNPAGGTEQVKGGTEDAFIAYVYYMYSAQLVAKAAGILGKREDENAYAALARDIHQFISDEYFTPNGRCAITTQTGYVLALYYRLTEQRDKAAQALKDLIHAKGDKIVTGFVGTPLILRVLSSLGADALAYTVLLNEEYPGWLYQVNLGATTVWERWNSLEPDGTVSSTGMNSFNHYAHGAVGEWMWRTIGGINPDESAPGFRRAVLRPVPNGKLGSARADYASPAGRWHVEWRMTDETHADLKITVPFDCTAQLLIPWAKGQKEYALEPGEFSLTCETETPL